MSGSYRQAIKQYGVDFWGEGYFGIDPEGFVVVNGPDGEAVRLDDVLAQAKALGLSTPILFRFSSILKDRVRKLCSAFHDVFEAHSYQGDFASVYPIKVNQQRHVVEALYSASDENTTVGLEAGSKPELMAVLALSTANSIIVCNGYKDREYIRLALIGERMGRQVFIVVEKLSELSLILEEAEDLGVEPRIGVRARLSSIGKGNWQNTGGEKSKFGLSAMQILDVLNRLKADGKLSALQMLHFHLGSQISNIRDIQKGMKEAARYFIELRKAGAEVTTVDVGGGLGVDYEGTHSRSVCSVNYSMDEYAHGIVIALQEACDSTGINHPNIITEAGRALTAHHAVLVSNVIGVDRKCGFLPEPLPETAPATLKDLADCWAQVSIMSPDSVAKPSPRERPLMELYHDVSFRMGEINEMYTHGILGLHQKAQGEALYYAICEKLSLLLDNSNRSHQPVLDVIHEKLADKLFVNFSLFQSMPDVWGIDQVFPIMPTKHLDKPLTRNGIIQDITCDSDGRIDLYVDDQGLSSYLAMPQAVAGDEEHLAMFMVGAYQEILGDMHNLFGDTCSVDVVIKKGGEFELQHPTLGESINDCLRHVNFEPKMMLQMMHEKLLRCGLSSEDQAQFLSSLRKGLDSYSYLA